MVRLIGWAVMVKESDRLGSYGQSDQLDNNREQSWSR